MVDSSKISENQKKELIHKHIINMKSPKKISAYFVPRMNSKKQSNNDTSFHMDNSYFRKGIETFSQ